MLDTLQAAGGIYVAMAVIAVISGVFPLVNSEVALSIVTLELGSLPQALVLAVIVACGQTITHTTLFFTARGVTEVSAKRREKLQAKIEKGRALVERWRDRWLLLVALAATFGLPPMILVALAAGAFGYRFRTFVIIGLLGRLLRFTTIAAIAYYVY